MKRAFMVLWMFAVPVFAHVSEPLRIAERLENGVERLRRNALDLSRQAPDPVERRKLVELSEESEEVRRTFQFSVVRELERGTPFPDVARNFERVRPKIQFLSRLAQALRVVPYPISSVVTEIEAGTRDLYRALQGGSSAVTARCEAHTETNVLTGAKTHVTCSFRGQGLTKYEVLLNYGSSNLQGHLYPQLYDQHITTERVRAGYWPKFEVFVTDQQGRRFCVAKN